MKQVPRLEHLRDFPICAISLANTLYNKTGSWRNFRPVYQNKLPPCNQACPSGEKIQGYIELINQQQYRPGTYRRDSALLRQAWELIKQDNPIPAVCGRVCFHPCETACNRSQYDEPIAVHNIERFIGDYGLKSRLRVKETKLKANKKIAIIGGGPAGLACAYHLARSGYHSTIFEATKTLGGLLMTGIPSYRLPKDVLNKEIKAIIRLGVKVITNVCIGRDKSFEALYRDYDAIFIATGAHKERKLNIPGEEHPDVIPALELLYRLNLKHKIKLGKKVAIIGGGNAAIDAARSILRAGSEPVIIYRRTRNEMPAIPDEIKDAEEENIKFIFLAAPVKIIIGKGKIQAVECIRMKLGTPDASGRRAPLPVKGSNFRIKVNNIIPAIGEEPDFSFAPPGLKTDGKVINTNASGATNLPGIFAGGDAVTGPRTVVEALGTGKKAAQAIQQYLKTGRMTNQLPDSSVQTVSFENINLNYFEPGKRVKPGKLVPKERVHNRKEVYEVYRPDELVIEAERCFSCGVCNQCDNCFVFCPDAAVLKKPGKKTAFRADSTGNNGYEFNYDYCKGCGICLTECPRNVISLEEEKR